MCSGPRILREFYAFKNWKRFDQDLWNKVIEEEKNKIKKQKIKLYGSDIIEKNIHLAKESIKKLKFENCITFETKNFINSAENSVLYESGNTKVLVTVSVSTRLPDWLLNSDKGWVTAEYNMLPGSSGNRISRKSYESGRSKEISRLIGRSLRAVCNLGIINGYSFTVDCDVLEADGGTRTASVNGAWIALNDTFEKMIQENKLNQNPLTSKVGAISVGIVADELVADLDYEKDSNAEVDLNLVLDEKFEILEIQGTAEGKPFPKEHLDQLFELGKECIKEVFEIQK